MVLLVTSHTPCAALVALQWPCSSMSVCLVQGTPKLDTVLQIWSHKFFHGGRMAFSWPWVPPGQLEAQTEWTHVCPNPPYSLQNAPKSFSSSSSAWLQIAQPLLCLCTVLVFTKTQKAILLCLLAVSLGWRTLPTWGMKGVSVVGRSKNKAEL